MPNASKITTFSGSWINKRRWDWYGTLTFADPVTREQALTRFKRWKIQLQKATGILIQYILVMETPENDGSPQINFLLSGANSENPNKWEQKWSRTNGEARIMKYQPGQGASHYIARQLANADAEVILGKGFRPTSKLTSN